MKRPFGENFGLDMPVDPGRSVIWPLAMLTGYVAADQRFIACPNPDVAYGGGFMTLDEEPIVFQVPDFGDRFWVYAHYGARTDEFSQIGKPCGTKPGFYLSIHQCCVSP